MFYVVLEENVRNKSKLHLRFTISQVRLAKQIEEFISELKRKKLAKLFFSINKCVVHINQYDY